MTKEERTTRLREIMEAHKLNAPAVGKILERSPQTVRSWTSKYADRTIPATSLRLLEREVTKPAAKAAK